MAPRKTKSVNQLLEAASFVALAQDRKSNEASTHCTIQYGWMIVSGGTLAAGSPIPEHDLNCCPQTERLRLALEQCGEQQTIIQQDDALCVRSGEFTGFVPLCDGTLLSSAVPDASIASLSDTFRASLKVTGSLVREKAKTVLQSCVQLNPYSTVGTNGNVILEAWHGFDMPPGLLVPKAFVDAVVKANKVIVSFGFNKDTFTVHFEDRSWLRTKLQKEKIPDILSRLVSVTPECRPFPPDFFKHVAALSKWSEDGRVYIHDGVLCSHPMTKERTGSVLSFPLPQMKPGISYAIDALKAIGKFAVSFNDQAKANVTMFYGDKLRGAIAHEAQVLTQEEANELSNADKRRNGFERVDTDFTTGITDDDIPF